MALANKYRPKTFDDVVGQEAVITTLKQEIEENNVPQCILLCGPAGTGKTTIARIISDSLKAELHELDAASNNGIDYVRTLQEESNRKSMLADCKAYILDEVHGFSTQAWQALLKLLEEPPANVYFILCTTETNKIPKTILSRVQKFFFEPLTNDKIVGRMKEVIEAEGCDITYKDDALTFIATKANGCMRDALSMLDVAISYNKNITLNSCSNALNEVSPMFVDDFVDAMVDKHINQAVRIVNDIDRAGMNLKQFIISCVYTTVNICMSYIKNDEVVPEDYRNLITWLLNVQKEITPSMSAVKFIEANIIVWCYD